MIGRIEDPDHPGRHVYVPLRWNDEAGRWELRRNGGAGGARCLRVIDAGVACWMRFRTRYRELVQAARILRVMCEHPDFGFEGDAVSSDMVRERARALSRAMSMEEEEVERLLDEPKPDDEVYIWEVRYELDTHRGRLEPAGRDTGAEVPMPPQGARARHEWLLRICGLFAEELTGVEPGAAEVAELVDRVQERLRGEDADEDEDADRGTKH